MKHVVVVEDDPQNQILFRKILEKRAGVTVTVTESPEELLELACSGRAALVIMDVSLPNSRWEGKPISGVELCRLMRQDPRSALVPVLLATAHAMRGDAETLLAESGATDYVSKPIVDLAAFVSQVRGLLEEAA